MNLVIDIGNTRLKAASFEGSTLTEKRSFEDVNGIKEYLAGKTFDHCIVSSVSTDTSVVIPLLPVNGKKIQLTTSLSLPVRIAYDTITTLGVDRIAAACGAYQLFPDEDCLVIDMGTCITYDFLSSEGVYEGGAIAPGVKMRFAAMHHFTARLPMVEPTANPALTGRSTTASMQSGVINGVLGEINEFIYRYQSQHAKLRTVACGGDLTFFENSLKPSIFVAPDLVLIGLNRILLHHIND